MAASEVSFNRKIMSEDLSNVEFDTSEDVEVIPTFDSMGLRDELLRGIYTYGNYELINDASNHIHLQFSNQCN